MSGTQWTPAQLKKLREIYKGKPKSTTNYELSELLSRQFHKSPESIRWQLRQLSRPVVEVKPAKILLLDIETLPINADVWDVWNININPAQVKKDWSIVCWGAKWLFSDKVMGQSVLPKEAINRTDGSVLGQIWDLVNEADIVISHNGNGFDLKRLNTRWLIAGYPPPMYYQSVDTLKILKENFSFTYNKLDWVNAVLGISRKMDTSFKWWDECGEGNQKYIDLMLKYNKNDVNVLEELYLKIRPWIAKHPNLNLFSVGDTHVCPNCGSVELSWEGKYATPLGLYQGFRCQFCGAIGRATKKQFKIKASVVSN